MKRITVAAVGSFVFMMLMVRGLNLQSEATHSAVNDTAALNMSDQVLGGMAFAGSNALPLGLLVAVIAMIFALGRGR